MSAKERQRDIDVVTVNPQKASVLNSLDLGVFPSKPLWVGVVNADLSQKYKSPRMEHKNIQKSRLIQAQCTSECLSATLIDVDLSLSSSSHTLPQCSLLPMIDSIPAPVPSTLIHQHETERLTSAPGREAANSGMLDP